MQECQRGNAGTDSTMSANYQILMIFIATSAAFNWLALIKKGAKQVIVGGGLLISTHALRSLLVAS